MQKRTIGMTVGGIALTVGLTLFGVAASALDDAASPEDPAASATAELTEDTGTDATVDETATDTGTTEEIVATEEIAAPAPVEAVVDTVADASLAETDTNTDTATSETDTSLVTETSEATEAEGAVEAAAVVATLPTLSYDRIGGYDVELTLTGGDATTYTGAFYTVNHATNPDVSSFPPVTGTTQVVTTASVPGTWDIYMNAYDLDGILVTSNTVSIVLPYEAPTPVDPDIASLAVYQCYGFTTSFGVVGGDHTTYQPNSFGLAWDLNGEYGGEKLVAVDTLPTILPQDYEEEIPGLWTVRPFVTSLQGERAYGEAINIQLPDCKDPEPVDAVIPVPLTLGPEYTDDDSTVKGDVVWNADKVATASDAVNTWFVAPNGNLFSKPTAANTTYPDGVLEFNHGKPTDVYVPPVKPPVGQPGHGGGHGGGKPVTNPGTSVDDSVAIVTLTASEPTASQADDTLPATGLGDNTGIVTAGIVSGVLGIVLVLFVHFRGRHREKLALAQSSSSEPGIS